MAVIHLNPSAFIRKMAVITHVNRSVCMLQFRKTATSSSPEINDETVSFSGTEQAVTDDPFMNLMTERFNSGGLPPTPIPVQKGYTENMSPTYLSTGNPCLDFFFHVVPDTPAETITQRLQLAWDHNPLTALKLVCNLRAIRGTGKSDREGYYTSALWIHNNHPKTLAHNVGSLVEFGYFKDMLEILYRLLEGADARLKAREARMAWLNYRSTRSLTRKTQPKMTEKNDQNEDARSTKMSIKEKVRRIREQKKIIMAKKVGERIGGDPDYKLLYERVSDLFADCLKADMEFLTSGELNKIGLSAKWCPSLDSSFDRTILLCDSIARKVFPPEAYPEYQDVEEANYAHLVRHRLRKEVLVPLRKALELPEVYIGANDWKSIPYNRVASVAMKLYKDKFMMRDRERFLEYLEKVREGKAKIAAGALLPHQIIASLHDADGGQVAELQWKRMVDDLASKGKLKNCLAICDVSGSMSGIPMEVSVALGILVSELSEDPWKGKLITFSANPKLQMVEGEDLRSKANFVQRMEWGMNTDFQKVFDLILEVAVNGKLKEEQMIKRLFVFSDMEFDQASGNGYGHGYGYNYGYGGYNYRSHEEAGSSKGWDTDYEVIKRKFGEKGYGNCVPEIVFWNLRDSSATPVLGNQKGVALVSGFSKNLIKLFMEESGEMNPEKVMEAAIAGEEYQKLVIVD